MCVCVLYDVLLLTFWVFLLSMQRKYAKQCDDPRSVNYAHFREWLWDSFPNGIDEHVWDEVMLEDTGIAYHMTEEEQTENLEVEGYVYNTVESSNYVGIDQGCQKPGPLKKEQNYTWL